MNAKVKVNTVDDYIDILPEDVQEKMQSLRNAIREAAPAASEVISYKMPAFKMNNILVWYGAFKNHVGFFPTAEAIEVFKKELSQYKASKGTIQFPFEKPLPLALVKKIVKYRVKEVKNKILIIRKEKT